MITMMTMLYICMCRNCDVASKCISYLLYFCSDVKAKYKSQLDQFKYACSHVADKDGMPAYEMVLFMARCLRNTFRKKIS